MLSAEQFAACGIVPVVVLEEAAQALPVAQALLAGGINVMEITFRTAAAKESIATVAREMPEMMVGAGTVINLRQLEEAAQAGAQFIVSPGSSAELIKASLERQLAIVPGVATPSEIMIGLELGLKVFKFFPAETYGGLKAIKALSGPFPQIRFIPTGGIRQDNAEEYLKNPGIIAVGGSWMVSADLIRSGRFDEITERSRMAVELARAVRS
ncbi:MAG: bifunctional 4-hydroxy-2-oxoglutarate aldolase/2-dehydro-3-deoxy-phosphogluconate aldolase [Clostridia bacterium]|nr:bifunctional 4-hydroxy-2-oxoglutarate aldolase/2-dehydro-3-deoxy-phosphogluconate aldolase [Clostridia bacterium]